MPGDSGSARGSHSSGALNQCDPSRRDRSGCRLDPLVQRIERRNACPDSTLDAAEDRFNDFFYSLYARDAPWSEELSSALAAHQIMVKFQRGEGFLLNDRQWLHGRTTTSGAVHEDRLHRLVFNSTEV